MTAVYPIAVRNFTVHKDQSDIVDASDVNALQDEVAAIESTLGLSPHVFAPPGASAAIYRNVGARLDAHEALMAVQQGQINEMLSASQSGWATPALTVTGNVNPGVRLMPVAGYLDPGPVAVSWSSESVNQGGMFVPNANTVAIPKGGLWSIDISVSALIDWTTLESVQSGYNHLGVIPVPIAYQRVAVSIWVQGTQVAYGPDTVHWLPASARPSVVLTGGNPPTQQRLAAVCSYLGPLASGSQIQVKAEQFFGNITGALVTASFRYERAIAGVD